MNPNHTCKFKRVSRRTIHRAPLVALAASILGIGLSSYAFVSLQAGALPMHWQNSSIVFTIHEAGDPRITDGSDMVAVRLAFRAWNEVPSSRVAFFEDTGQGRGRTDWQSDDIHLVIWDMQGTSGFFDSPAGGLVAITPVDFEPSTGRILDADIIFNGKNYLFSTDLTGGTFDIQNVATHEVGHFIGLDHSAVVGATMNPFAHTGDTRLRSLEQDDIAGASAIYPNGAQPGWIEGYVRLDGQPVSGAHVVAEDLDGTPCSAGLSDGSGFFRIRGLDQGQYVVYAEPLDGPVRDVNFSLQTSGLQIHTNFGTTFWGASGGRSNPGNPDRVAVSWGAATRLEPSIVALPKGMNVTGLGSSATVAPGNNGGLTVVGSQLNRANRIDVPGPGLFVGNNPTFSAGSASVSLQVLASAMPSLRTVRLWNDQTWECAVLTGGLEVRRPRPMIEGLNPTSVQPGATVQVYGDGFQSGARAIVGQEVLNAIGQGGQVSFTVPAGLSNGAYAVTIENPDGQFARLAGALEVSGSSAPAGSSGGGTTNTSGGPQQGGGLQPVAPAAGGASPRPVNSDRQQRRRRWWRRLRSWRRRPRRPRPRRSRQALALVLAAVVRRRRAA
ncbi:MAG: matrixin family metalloprotease [Planctomycetes bacterium]|nr:matrixin family metalloprotease [Planctomycetota bacterium]